MFLDPYVTQGPAGPCISAAQASRFAKEVAGDFNPLHDPDNKRFCVPGDLLFALVLARHGLAAHMEFAFTGMLGADLPLDLPTQPGEAFAVRGGGRTVLEVRRRGPVTRDAAAVEALVRRYVAFSGHNFPDILVPLMERHGVMISPDRPLVVYERMALDLEPGPHPDLDMTLTGSTLEQAGRRGDAHLHFELASGGRVVGRGTKKLVLSGLRDYESAAMQGLVGRYQAWRAAYLGG
jgi:hypothetical protein